MDTTVTIATLIAVCSFVFTAYNFVAARKSEVVESSARLEEIKESLLKCNMKLDTVCAATNETRVDIKSLNSQIQALDKEMQTLDKEIAVVKRDLNTAFVRIDELREAQNG